MPWKSMIASFGTGLVNNALSQQNVQDQREWQEKMWKMQNAYNHPAAMADRMLSAGLNPYMMQGAEPSASFGTGATAQTIPLDNPLAYAKTFAEIDNLNSITNKTDIESEKIMKDIAMLDFLLQRQWISNEEYEFKVKKYIEAFMDRNPFTIEANKTEAETEQIKAETKESNERIKKTESERLFTEALTATENALRDARVQTEKARATAENASATANLAQANLLIQQGKVVELQADREAFTRSAEAFFGFNFTGMDPELVASLMSYYSDVYSDKMDPQVALQRAHNDIQSYIDKDLYISKSEGFSVSSSAVWGLLSGSYSDNSSGNVSIRRQSSGGGGSRW